MYVIDITRNSEEVTSDILVADNSATAKEKTTKYIMDYLFANYGVVVKEIDLDRDLNINSFSLNDFMKSNYGINLEENLLIQSIVTNKDNCLFVKSFNKESDLFPAIYTFNKNDFINAKNLLIYIANDNLIKKYQDNLDYYDNNKLTSDSDITKFIDKDINCEIISLYKDGKFLDELLDSNISLNELNGEDITGIDLGEVDL